MATISNYKIFPVLKISADGEWKVPRMMVRNRISGVVRWFTMREIEAMKWKGFVMPASTTTCTRCDTALLPDGTCQYGCAKRTLG